jgi:excisionase family DNA binding protein
MGPHKPFNSVRLPGGQELPFTKSDEPEKLLVTKAEAARLLSVSEKTLFNLTKKGEIPVLRLGNKLTRYSSSDLREWAAKNCKITPPTDPTSK